MQSPLNVPDLDNKAIDLGQLVHMLVLGGEDQFTISTFPDFRSKCCRASARRASANKHYPLDMFKAADQILKYREPHSEAIYFAKGATFEHGCMLAPPTA